MIPPNSKAMITSQVEKHVSTLKIFKSSLPVIMIGELKLDRIDHKVSREAIKLNNREIKKTVKVEGTGNSKYDKRKAAITYRSYTVEFKKKLIRKIKELDQTTDVGLSKIIRAKGKQLKIHPKNIFRWYHTKEIKKKEGGRKALFPQMQDRLAQFIVSNPKMKRKHILRQAKKIMQDLDIPGRDYFNFSKGWYERFRDRLIRKKIISGKLTKREPLEGIQSYSQSEFQDSRYLQNVKKQQKLEFQPLLMCKYQAKIQAQDEGLKKYDESEEEQFEESDEQHSLVKSEYISGGQETVKDQDCFQFYSDKQSVTKITISNCVLKYQQKADNRQLTKNNKAVQEKRQELCEARTNPNHSKESNLESLESSKSNGWSQGNQDSQSIWNEDE